MAKSAFQARVRGPVFTLGDAGYASEVATFNTAVVQTPEVVVGVTSREDVIEAVRVARELRLRVSVQGAGHGGLMPVRSGLLINTRRLDHVSVDAEARVATVGAGVPWWKVVEAASEHGLAPVCGSSVDVGVMGYLLGGGLGPLARSHGFSSDYVVSAEVVTGTGELLRVSSSEHSDLFWALRGGKVGLGVVTEVRVRLVPLPSLYAGFLAFDGPVIERVLRGYIDFTRDAPSEVTTSAAIVHFPNVEAVPEIFRGRRILSLRFAYPGPVAEGERLARPLRELGPIHLDSLGELPAVEVAKISNDPRRPLPSAIVAMLLGQVDQGFVDRVLEALEEDSPFTVAEIRHLGGATRVDAPEGSAVGGRGAEYSFGVIASNPALFETVVPAAGERLLGAMEPYRFAETNINFLEGPHAKKQLASAWSPATFARLEAVRRKYDPDGVFSLGD